MLDYDYCFIGGICQVLDASKLHYHHCRTWFRLFPDEKENTYSIESSKNNNNESEVVVYKGNNTSRYAPIIFKGNLQNFEKWLYKISKTQPTFEEDTEGLHQIYDADTYWENSERKITI